MRRLTTIAAAPIFAGLVYLAFASSAARKWWQGRHRKGAEVNTYP